MKILSNDYLINFYYLNILLTIKIQKLIDSILKERRTNNERYF